ncbi:sulfotransferase family protein [Salipiger aestuarii]|uniref:Sulfotransferase family protein n=1 Tax=Salipiger aestuarii TaxID=568098 RepID=A0A327XMU7_9RHOB|nr:sulfotransferase family protein [Salipiger aestuarii]RAK09884.1 hypothetical protein ATI53_106411 [Salipiger aestuarii]
MSDDRDLKLLVDDALALLSGSGFPVAIRRGNEPTPPLGSLLTQCRNQVRVSAEAGPEPLRMLHHFACTGGTLVARALASQPNTMVLSELDPLSTMVPGPGVFAPSDVILMARHTHAPPSDAAVGRMFSAALRSLRDDLAQEGRYLVLRDHTHSHFCTNADPTGRATIGAILARDLALRQAITVRHPLDSYASLLSMDWVANSLNLLDHYAGRYLIFLDAYPGVPIHYYEHFTEDPDDVCRQLAQDLDLPYSARWQDLLPMIRMSGDSGRKGMRIAPRARRPLPPALLAEVEAGCPAYEALCDRLGYDPDPAASAVPFV